MLIEFTSQMDYADFLEFLEDKDTPCTGNRDELQVTVEKEDLLGAMEIDSEIGLEGELTMLYGGKIEDWHDD